ncbi:MAG: M50 family metallopeptidase [Capsulimonadales bacterium]|nr:M50 family metallopeptidase [Capsulimonadales bacterium]
MSLRTHTNTDQVAWQRSFKENPFMADSETRPSGATRTLLLAALITIGLYFVPYAGYVTYPIRLLVTLIHEGSHALMSLLTGGWVQSISIEPDGSGLTMSLLRGWLPQVLVASAGYLGATLYGAGLIYLLRRGASGRPLLLGTGILTGLVTLGIFLGLIFTGNVFGLFWGLMITAGLLIAGLKLPKGTAGWLAAFVGVQCVLNALFDLRTLFTLSVSTLAPTDAMGMARLTLIPAPIWAALWIITAFFMLWLVLRPARSSR